MSLSPQRAAAPVEGLLPPLSGWTPAVAGAVRGNHPYRCPGQVTPGPRNSLGFSTRLSNTSTHSQQKNSKSQVEQLLDPMWFKVKEKGRRPVSAAPYSRQVVHEARAPGMAIAVKNAPDFRRSCSAAKYTACLEDELSPPGAR